MRKRKLLYLFFVLSFFANNSATTQNDYSLVPYPNKIVSAKGVFTFSDKTGIINQSNPRNARILKQYLENDKGIYLKERIKNGKVILLKETGGNNPKDESYCLSITPDTIKIQAANSSGVFYGIQTLRQLIDKKSAKAPCLTIQDSPEFSWRAFMLDDCRYFKGKEVVKQLLDEMASIKMNIFHWHLTDDQGWRIQIKKYPKLTEIGGQRDSSQIGGWESKVYDGVPHSGYYTQNDIREIVKYASERHITIVPEIEMPGHATAAVASYPFVGVLEHPIPVPGTFGIKSSVFNVADERVITFLHDVLEEVFNLFPGEVVHIGGDEIHLEEWKASKDITSYMKKLNLQNYNDLQLYFTNQMSRFIEDKGRRMMGWNDIMGKNIHEWSAESDSKVGELSKNAVIHFWKGDSVLVREALEEGYSVVNSYHYFTYLDYDYEKLPVSKAYNFSPFPSGIDEKYRPQLLGSGCQVWCEWIPDKQTLYRQVFPRLAAYAEVGWTSPGNKDYKRFCKSYNFIFSHRLPAIQ